MTYPTTAEMMDHLTELDWHMDYEIAAGLISKGLRAESIAQGETDEEKIKAMSDVALADFDKFLHDYAHAAGELGARMVLDRMERVVNLRDSEWPGELHAADSIRELIGVAREYTRDTLADEPKDE